MTTETAWAMWQRLAKRFAEEARDRRVPFTHRREGNWWERDRDEWQFRVRYLWTEGAGELYYSVTITKSGRLTVKVPAQTRPFNALSLEGKRAYEPIQEATAWEAMSTYISRNSDA